MLFSMNLLIFVVHIRVVVMDSKFAAYRISKIKDSKMAGYINTFWRSSLVVCAAKCEETDTCATFSFHAEGTCELNEHTPDNQPVQTVSGVDWGIYVKQKEMCWPVGYDGFVWNGMCYFWKQPFVEVAWINGRNDCRAHKAELVCMDSAEEEKTVIDTVPMSRWWFGATFEVEDGVLSCYVKNAGDMAFWSYCGIILKGLPGYSPCFSDEGLSYVCEMTWQ